VRLARLLVLVATLGLAGEAPQCAQRLETAP
jgi:hypothetical protein